MWQKIAHDGRECRAIEHPALTYYGGYVAGNLVAVFTHIRFSRWEVEAHAAVLRHAMRHGRPLAKEFLTRCFADTNVLRVTANILGTLPTAANFCRKLGFVDEGRRRAACSVDGVPTDIVVLGITRDDWSCEFNN